MMGRRPTAILGTASALAIAAIAACGDDTLLSPVSSDAGRGAADGSDVVTAPPAAVDAGHDAGPIRAEFGLDARPTNVTCKAPARPAAATGGVAFEQVFGNVPSAT